MNGVLTPLAIVGIVLFGIAVLAVPALVVANVVRSVRQIRGGRPGTVHFQVRWGGRTLTGDQITDDELGARVLEQLLEDEAVDKARDRGPSTARRDRDPSIPEGWGFD